MPDSLQPVTSATAARYKYYTVDIMSNTIIGEIPFEDVSYENTLKQAGAFDGKITVSGQTEALDLYRTTLPGRTALYVVRDNVCVWGGIIWGRSYDLISRSLTVSGSEFTSYLNHRLVWKTYSSNFIGSVSKDAKGFVFVGISDREMKSPPVVKDASGSRNTVYLTFKDRSVTKFNGIYEIHGVLDGAPSDPTVAGFYIGLNNLPKPKLGSYDGVSVSMRADTYEYVRDLITSAFEDFTDIDFVDEVTAPGIAKAISVSSYSIAATGTYTGTGTLNTSKPHKLAKGQTVELANIHPLLSGEFSVSGTPSAYAFTVPIANQFDPSDKTTMLEVDNVSTTAVSATKDRIQYREIINSVTRYISYIQRSSGVITLTTTTKHKFKKGDVITVKVEGKAPALKTVGGKSVNTFNWDSIGGNNVPVYSVTPYTVTFLDPDSNHTSTSYNVPKTKVLTAKKNTVKFATPRVQLKLYPRDSHGYISGDRVKISGVDDLGWQTPIYDGYNKVVDADAGIARTITHYSADSDDDIVVLYFATDPMFEISDWITVSSANKTIKGTHQIVKVTDPADDTSDPYQVSISKIVNVDEEVAKTSVSGATAAITGDGWITFDPGYDQLSTVSLKEPNAAAQIESLFFDTGSTKDRAGTVYVDTVDRHGFRVGDVVNVEFTDPSTNKIYGARDVVVKGNSDNDTIVYGIKDSDVPHNDTPKVAKKGTITRTKARIGGSPIVESSFRQIYTDGNLVTVVAEGHNFSVGDNIIIAFANDSYNMYDSGEGSVKIVAVKDNSFSYYSAADVSTSSQVIVKRIDFPAAQLTNPTTGTATNVIKLQVVTDNVLETTEATEETPAQEVLRTIPLLYIGTTNNATGQDYVDFTTDGSGSGLKVGDKISVTGLPTSVNTTEPAVNRAENTIVPFKIKYDYVPAKKYADVTFYLDENPWMPTAETITVGGFRSQKVKLSTGKLKTVDMWKLQTALKKPSSPNTLTRQIRVLSIPTTSIDASGKKTTKNLGYGVTKDSTGDITNYYVKIRISGGDAFDWTWTGSDSTQGQDRGYITVAAKTLAPEKVTKQVVAYSVYNVTDARIAKVENSGEKISVAISNPVKIPTDVFIGGYGVVAKTTSMTAAQKVILTSGPSTAAPSVVVGDSFKISGFKDIGTDKYSRLNGISYTVLKVDADPRPEEPLGQRRYSTIYIKNPLKPFTKYTSRIVESESVKATAFHNVSGFAALDYGSISTETREITQLSRTSSSTATLTSNGHGLVAGDWVNVWLYGKRALTLNANNEPVQITSATTDTITYSIPGDDTCEVTKYSVARNADKTTVVLTVQPGDSHRFIPGDTVTLSSFPSQLSSKGFTGNYVLTAASPKTLTFTTTTTGITALVTTTKALSSTGTVTLSSASTLIDDDDDTPLGLIIPSPMVTKEPVAFTRSYGEYAGNSNLGGMDFSTNNYSNLTSQNTPLRGSELVNVGSHLEEYSNNLHGFDYRIDCSLVTDSVTGNKKFKRVFRFIPIYPSTLTTYINSLPLQDDPYNPNSSKKIHALAPGQVAPPTAFGADKVVFEYPGNISNINFSENAESSATRIFVSSANGQAGGGDAAYSGAVAEELLADGWPLLDRAEKADWPAIGGDKVNIDNWGNYDTELDLFKTAKRYVYESKPPAGNFVVSVNGSLNPVIGSYSPGDWCSIIVNDEFIKTRLRSSLEPRKDVIIRKIDAVKVIVPNNPAFPEQIDLSIVTDWQVDKVGE